MSKKITPAQIEMPPHLAAHPKSLPVFRVDHPMFGQEDQTSHWEKRLAKLGKSFQIEGQATDAGDRLLLQDKDKHRVLQIYKPSHSFLYYDRSLASPTDPKYADSMLDADTAKKRAHAWLEANGLLDQYPVFEGYSYSGVSFSTSGNTPGNHKQTEGKEYLTEIKPCFGFKIGQMPVLGPGAKIMAAYVGDTMSQLAYFWRNPQPSPIGEQKILPPQSVQKHFASDPRFAHLNSEDSKIRINEIRLGYYALPPYAVQEYYFPVYQLKGIVETRGGNHVQGYDALVRNEGSIIQETLRHDFNYFLPAGNLTLEEFKRSGFPPPHKDSFIF
ncbi:MAG: hypothetical protein ACKVUS_04760 [Saprospiraceae bacterium]